jgi:hypothetical protein
MDKILEILIKIIKFLGISEFCKTRKECLLYLIKKQRRINNPGNDNKKEREEIKERLSNFESRFVLCQNSYSLKTFQCFINYFNPFKIPNNKEIKELVVALRSLRNNIYGERLFGDRKNSENFEKIMKILRMGSDFFQQTPQI